jgi:hypothetical protein
MPPESFRQWLTQRPFLPFQFFVLETTRFDVLRPDMVLIERVTLLFYPHSVKPLKFTEQPLTIALRHISRIEPFTGS